MKGARVVGALGLVLLVGGYLDFWREPRARLYFGWLPEELAWRLGYVLACVLYLAFVTRVLWVEEDGE